MQLDRLIMKRLQRACGILLWIYLVAAANLQVGLVMTQDHDITKEIPSFDLFNVTAFSGLPSQIEAWIDETGISVVYDLSFSERESYELSVLAQAAGIVHVIGWSEAAANKFKAIYPHCRKHDHIKAATTLLEFLGIAEILLLSNEFSTAEAYSKRFKLGASAVLVEDTSQASFDKTIARDFKPVGVRTTLLDISSSQALKVSRSLEVSRMLKEGYVHIFSPKAAWAIGYLKGTGHLLIVDEGTEQATSALEYELMSLNWGLSKLKRSYNTLKYQAHVLEEALSSRRFTLINLVDSQPFEAGMIDGGYVTLRHTLVFPGNATSLHLNDSFAIAVSTISSNHNDDGTTDNYNSDSFLGAFYAFSELEANMFLGRFVMKPRLLKCGAIGYDPDYQRLCIAREKASLGVAILSGYTSGHTTSILLGLSYNNLTTPVIGSRTTSSALSSKKVWPNFIRTLKTTVTLTPAISAFLSIHQYNMVNLFYSDEPYGRDFYSYMLSSLNLNKVEIVTPEALRAVPFDLTINPSKYTLIAESVLQSEIRPTIFLVVPTYRQALLDLFYAVGIRKDYILSINYIQDSGLWTQGTAEQIKDRMELLVNSVFLDNAAFIGVLGGHIKSSISVFAQEPANVSHCQYYDSTYLLANSLKAMLLSGKDFEDPAQLIAQLRDTTFYGCTGRVAIDSDSNDRRDQDIDIYNLVNEDSQWQHNLIYRISLTSKSLITQFGEMKYPNGDTSKPPLHRFNYDGCPFPEEERQHFEKGSDLILCLSIVYTALTLCFAAIILSKGYLSSKTQLMQDRRPITFNDRMLLSFVFIYNLQYIGHGPNLRGGNDIFVPLITYFSGGAIEDIEFTKGVYWTLLNTALALVVLWFIFCQLIWMRIVGRDVKCLKWLTDLGEKSMPWLGNALFLPINSLMFDVFVCTEAHGADPEDLEFKDSFMYRDCNEDCWEGSQLKYAISGGIILIFYFILTVLTLPRWQDLTPDLNVQTRQTYYLQKSLIEIALVVLRRGLRDRSPLWHALLYLGVIGLHMITCVCRRPFSYARVNLWKFISMFSVFSYGAVCTVQQLTEFSDEKAIIAFYSLTCGSVVVGVLAQCWCIPSLLESKQEKNLGELFKFAFHFGSVKPPPGLEKSTTEKTDSIQTNLESVPSPLQ